MLASAEKLRPWNSRVTTRFPATTKATAVGSTKNATRPSPASRRVTIRTRSVWSIVDRAGSSAAATLMPNRAIGNRYSDCA